jgi:hypothetical protein
VRNGVLGRRTRGLARRSAFGQAVRECEHAHGQDGASADGCTPKAALRPPTSPGGGVTDKAGELEGGLQKLELGLDIQVNPPEHLLHNFR